MRRVLAALVLLFASAGGTLLAANIPRELSQQDVDMLSACVAVSGRTCAVASVRLGDEWRVGEYYLTCEPVAPATAGKTYRVQLTRRPMCDVTVVP